MRILIIVLELLLVKKYICLANFIFTIIHHDSLAYGNVLLFLLFWWIIFLFLFFLKLVSNKFWKLFFLHKGGPGGLKGKELTTQIDKVWNRSPWNIIKNDMKVQGGVGYIWRRSHLIRAQLASPLATLFPSLKVWDKLTLLFLRVHYFIFYFFDDYVNR